MPNHGRAELVMVAVGPSTGGGITASVQGPALADSKDTAFGGEASGPSAAPRPAPRPDLVCRKLRRRQAARGC